LPQLLCGRSPSLPASLIFVINGEVIRGFDNLHEQQLKWWNHQNSDDKVR
jgi:hypothetical protein